MRKLPDIKILDFLRYLIRQFIDNQGILNASALTYTTLFAVVPLMTVTYSMLSAIPQSQGLGANMQNWIFENFVPATGAVVQDYLADFASQAKQLTLVGVGFLFVTAVMMMKSIESAFNRIWRVTEARKGVASFLLYWAVLSLGPVLIGIGVALTSYIASLSFITSATDLVGRARLLALLPMLFSTAAFTLLYTAVPNCRVPLKNAFISALVVAILFETAKRGFALFVTNTPSYQLIYGAFAAVPLFLLWIYISWIIILMGAELSRALSVYSASEREQRSSHLHTVLTVLQLLWQAQQKGETLSDQCLLKQIKALDQGRWDTYLQILLEAGLVSRTEQGHFVLCRDMGSLTLSQLSEYLPWPLPHAEQQSQADSWRDQTNARLAELDEARQSYLGVTLEQLFNEKRHTGMQTDS